MQHKLTYNHPLRLMQQGKQMTSIQLRQTDLVNQRKQMYSFISNWANHISKPKDHNRELQS